MGLFDNVQMEIPEIGLLITVCILYIVAAGVFFANYYKPVQLRVETMREKLKRALRVFLFVFVVVAYIALYIWILILFFLNKERNNPMVRVLSIIYLVLHLVFTMHLVGFMAAVWMDRVGDNLGKWRKFGIRINLAIPLFNLIAPFLTLTVTHKYITEVFFMFLGMCFFSCVFHVKYVAFNAFDRIEGVWTGTRLEIKK